MRTLRITALLSLVLLAALNTLGVAAQEDGSLPAVTIQASADGLTVPEEMPEGAVSVTIENNSEAPVVPMLFRLNEGESLDSFMAAMANGPEAGIQLGTLFGGMLTPPGATSTANYSLVPGSYIVLDLGGEMPGVAPFTVADAEGEGVALPMPDDAIHVHLYDFAFSLPTQVSAGEHTFVLHNEGEQWHEMVVMPLDSNMSLGEFTAMLNAAASEDSGPPSEGLVWLPMAQGTMASFDLNLEPGLYGVLCFLPDLLGEGHTHASEGMWQIIEVSAAE